MNGRIKVNPLAALGRGLLAAVLLAGIIGRAADSSVGLAEQPLAPRSGPRGATLFTELAPADTGIVTENNYDDPAMWAEHYADFAVGAVGTGVAIGDYDGDGRPDVFVVSKTETCRLFRNLGNWKFEDVTEKAGVGDLGVEAGVWKQGATFVDVNNDGRLDIYVCRYHAPNRLYINQGDGTFREEAAARGLAVNDASVMAAFCDYDRDGWLDVFIQTNQPEAAGGSPRAQRNYLLHNNGDGTFTDVTERAGIKGQAQGHSAIWWDYDGDGWPDLYVANDFTPPDKLYHNNHDGTFTDTIDAVMPHQPFSSMGSDLGDVNNDGRIDLLVADMAATTHQKDQRTMANARSLIQDLPAGSTAAPFVMRNALYLNTGTGHFLEAACLAGVAATDWTWSVRLEDLDNDGRLDLYVTNGMYREPHNADLMARIAAAESVADKIRTERASPVLAEPNLAFRNEGDLQFADVSAAWGLDQKGVSFGAAFGDLDGDGDLDLVVANYNKGVTVLRNDSDTGHRLIVALRGTRSNRFGVGAVVTIETAAGRQVRPLVLARGVLSSSEPVVHFGLGGETRVERLTVAWPSGAMQEFADLAADRKFTITEPPGPPLAFTAPPPVAVGQFTEVGAALNLDFPSRATPVDELGAQPLLPVRHNRFGPAVAVGTLGGQARDGLVVGGTPTEPVRLLRADPAGRFLPSALAGPAAAGPVSDGPMLLFDADGDGTMDLLVTKAGVARPAGAPDYQPRLYLNDGHGGLRLAPDGTLPPLPVSIGAVAAADFDGVGRLGLFLGGRVLPGQYPVAPPSALWANRGGKFEDVTAAVAPGLQRVGMVTAARWSDLDGDGWPDLVVAVEWGGVRYFHNHAGKSFEDWTERSGFAAAGNGWWRSLATADFNGDGRPDLVAGNLGWNTPYQASAAHPALLYSGDFAGNGLAQLVEAYYEGEQIYPRRARRDLGAVLPAILRRFPRNDSYARATLAEVLGEEKLAAASRFTAAEFRSGVFLSQPDGTWRFAPLPRLAQIAPLEGVVAGDFDGDGKADIYAVQNSSAPIPSVGRFDGGLSQLLRGDGHGHFSTVAPAESRLVVPGAAQAVALLDLNDDGWPDFLVTQVDGPSLAFRNNGVAGRASLRVSLHERPGNPAAVGARVTLVAADGSRQTGEISADSGHLGQSASVLFFGHPLTAPPGTIEIRWPHGATTHHEVPAGAVRFEATAPEK